MLYGYQKKVSIISKTEFSKLGSQKVKKKIQSTSMGRIITLRINLISTGQVEFYCFLAGLIWNNLVQLKPFESEDVIWENRYLIKLQS